MATMSFKRPRRGRVKRIDFILAGLRRQSWKTRARGRRSPGNDQEGPRAAEVPSCWQKNSRLLPPGRRLGRGVGRGFRVGHRGLSLVGDGDQPQRLAHFGLDLGRDVLVVLQELLGILPALADALALVAEP